MTLKYGIMYFSHRKEICAFFAAHPVPNATPTTSSAAYPPSPSIGPASGATPNVLITSSLSVSFRRLDKYPALLQELQRYTEECHPDRGDTQRAGYVYREIAVSFPNFPGIFLIFSLFIDVLPRTAPAQRDGT